MPQDPTIPPPEPDSLNSPLRRNIDALRKLRLVELVSEIAERLHVAGAEEEEIGNMKRRVAPGAVLDAIEESEAA